MSKTSAPAAEVKGILVTHGSMGSGMVDAVRKIAGVEEGVLVAVSNEGKGPDDLVRAVNEIAGPGPAVIFTDLQTGSCAFAARFACRDPGCKGPEGRRIIFGANLPMLLDFVFHRQMPVDELVARLTAKGRDSIHSSEP